MTIDTSSKEGSMLYAPRPMRPLPEDVPLIIFSGVYAKTYIKPLDIARVDSVMCSFEYVRGNPRKFHENIMPLLRTEEWQPRLYLDSGVFTLMRKAGTSRATKHHAHSTVVDKVEAFKALARDYAVYLERYGDQWDHVVELDVDQVLGPQATLAMRNVLRRYAGDRLMPVWHMASGEGSWERMVSQFPYVSIGGDAGLDRGSRSEPAMAMYRDMVRYAHAAGVLVHGMGDTKESTFRSLRWDSGDSTTWVNGQKYGKFGTVRYSEMEQSSEGAKASRAARSFEDWLRGKGLDPAVIQMRKQTIDKLIVNVYLLQEREAQLRRERRFGREDTELTSEGSAVSVV